MNKEILKRLQSKVTIVSMLSLIYFVTKYWIGFEIPEWAMFSEIVIALLIGFGVLNNPTNREQF